MGRLLFFLFKYVVVPLIIYWFIRAFFRSLGTALQHPSEQPRRPNAARTTGELKKDPVCGTYVPTEGSFSRQIGGEVVYFCSAACRDKYHAAQ